MVSSAWPARSSPSFGCSSASASIGTDRTATSAALATMARMRIMSTPEVYSAPSTLWICATTAAPSPTAAATRLVEPARTSPMAKTPGRLVSSGRTAATAALRCATSRAGHDEALVIERDAAVEPVGVRIGADEQEEMAQRDRRAFRPLRAVAEHRAGEPRCSSPSSADDLGRRYAARHWAGRRCGRSDSATSMASSPSPRTTRCRRLTFGARKTTACPAELPPPTSATSSPCAELRLDGRGPIGDAGALEGRKVRDRRPAVARARRR